MPTQKLGKGYLQNMRLLFLKYPNCQTLSGNLTWSHYCELIYVEDEAARKFYEIETEVTHWKLWDKNNSLVLPK